MLSFHSLPHALLRVAGRGRGGGQQPQHWFIACELRGSAPKHEEARRGARGTMKLSATQKSPPPPTPPHRARARGEGRQEAAFRSAVDNHVLTFTATAPSGA